MTGVEFPKDLEDVLMNIHRLFSIDITEYVVEAVREDLRISLEDGNDTVLNKMIDASKKEALAVLEGAQ